MSFHSRVALDFPVSLGGYRHPRDPAEPMVLHLVHVPGAPNSGLDARAQFRVGRAKLFAMTFADFEAKIRDELDRMLGPGGFSSARDIAGDHGQPLVRMATATWRTRCSTATITRRRCRRARQTVGRVAIANSDAGGDAYAHLAIDQADRAVRELLGDDELFTVILRSGARPRRMPARRRPSRAASRPPQAASSPSADAR